MYSRKLYTRERFVVEVVVAGTFCLIGLVCNVLALVGLWKDTKKNSTVYILSALAVSDWLILVTLCLTRIIPFLCVYTDAEPCYGALFGVHVYIWAVGCMAQTAMVWLVVMASTDRYIAVCHPFKVAVVSTVANTKKVIAVIWVVAVLVNVPRFFYFVETDHSRELATNNTQQIDVTETPTRQNVIFRSESPPKVVHVNGTDPDNTDFDVDYDLSRYKPSPRRALGMTLLYRVIYYISFTWIFMYMIPLLMLLILNIKLTKAIQRAKLRHARMVIESPQDKKNNRSVTINIIAVVVVLLVCQTPDLVQVVLSLPVFNIDEDAMALMSSVNTLFMAINSSTNFFVYCLFYRKFRRVVQSLMCPAGDLGVSEL